MKERATGWRDCPHIDATMVATLSAAVGPEVFATLRAQFADDLNIVAATFQRARLDGDSAGTRNAAHALRGAALNIGLVRLGQLAADLEAGEYADADELEGVLRDSLADLTVSV